MLARASFYKQSDDVVVEFLLRSASPVAVLASRDGRRHVRRKPKSMPASMSAANPTSLPPPGGFRELGKFGETFLKNYRKHARGRWANCMSIEVKSAAIIR